jgi:hypothetical protein
MDYIGENKGLYTEYLPVYIGLDCISTRKSDESQAGTIRRGSGSAIRNTWIGCRKLSNRNPDEVRMGV